VILKATFNIKNDMYVCLCVGVTDHEIRETIAQGAASLEEVAYCTGAGTRCGSCVSTIAALVEDRDAQPRRCGLRVLTSAA
jgi:bacterioferritin-associated ferredoxin